jgi:hypothetical protein
MNTQIDNAFHKIERMKLIDEFAGKALQGILANPKLDDAKKFADIVNDSYKIAVCMSEARKHYIK